MIGLRAKQNELLVISPDFLIDLEFELELEIENETISQWRYSISSVYNCVQLYTDEIL